MDREGLTEIIRRSGCTVTRVGSSGWPTEFDCEDPWSKVKMLDALATADARYDPRVRMIALCCARGCPDTRPATLAAALHALVKRRVRYVGEGIETFQSAWQTWTWRMGDCDDSARLLVALARALGLPAHVVGLRGKSGDPVHAVAVVCNTWADASLDAKIGEHPLRARRRLRSSGQDLYNYQGGDIGDLGDVAQDQARVTARAALEAAWRVAEGVPAVTPAALQAVQSIALGPEGSDGSGCWTYRGSAPACPAVCHNWAGLQMPGSPTTHDGSVPNCPPGSAPCTDRLADGTPFGVCFKTYPDQTAGAVDYLHRLCVVYGAGPVISSGNADLIARTMFENHYFTGTEGSDADRIATYASAIAGAAQRIADSLGEPVYVVRGDPYGGGVGSPHAKLFGVAALGLLGVLAYRRGWHRSALAAARGIW